MIPDERMYEILGILKKKNLLVYKKSQKNYLFQYLQLEEI